MKDHWSATQFMTWEMCPGEYRERYVDGVAFQMTEAVGFGKAVHLGLEAHYLGHDGEVVFRRAWKEVCAELHIPTNPLAGTGLELLDRVFELNLKGEPERAFRLETAAELDYDIVGAIDLITDEGVVVDFKTTRGIWSQERAQRETWQPILYTWAQWEQEPSYDARFEYIVMNRYTGGLDRFRREWTADEWVVQRDELWKRMRLIAGEVAAGRFTCRDNHGFCQECGARWGHAHVCETRGRRIHIA